MWVAWFFVVAVVVVDDAAFVVAFAVAIRVVLVGVCVVVCVCVDCVVCDRWLWVFFLVHVWYIFFDSLIDWLLSVCF